MNTYIDKVIEIAYKDHVLTQLPNEFRKFCEFYYTLRCKNVLEVGSYFGGTFYALCKLSEPDGVKVSLDCPIFANYPDELYKKRTSGAMNGFADNVVIINTDSHAVETQAHVADIIKDDKFDFIFIDGDHSYEGVKKDFEMYTPFLKKGGYVGFHDIKKFQHSNDGVEQFWKELNYPVKLEFKSDGFAMGIGVLKFE